MFLPVVMICQYSGCGKKGPPVPPGYVEPTAVDDLRYQISGDTVTLVWTIPKAEQKPTYDVAGTKVYRLKSPMESDACPDCPLVFSLVKKILSKSGKVQYRETLGKGFRYSYKVVVYDAADKESPDSNIIQFTFNPK